MNATVQKDMFYMKARKYGDDPRGRARRKQHPGRGLHRGWSTESTPTCPTFQRYLKLRKRMMGVNELHYYDLYAPLVGVVEPRDTRLRSPKREIVAALAPLGKGLHGGDEARSSSGGSTCIPRRQAVGRVLERARSTTCTRTCC